jgi:hypothetical protein
MNQTVPEVSIPYSLIGHLDAPDKVECAIEISVPILSGLAASSQGLHLIAVGWQRHFSRILAAAGIDRMAL